MLPSAIKQPPRKLFRQKGQKKEKLKNFLPAAIKQLPRKLLKQKGQKEKIKKNFLAAIKRLPQKLFRQKGQKTKIFPTCNKTASPEVIKAEGAKKKKQKFFLPAAIKQLPQKLLRQKGQKEKIKKNFSSLCNKTTSPKVIQAEGQKSSFLPATENVFTIPNHNQSRPTQKGCTR